MVKMILGVEGMACGMCEAHVNDAVRRNFPVKKVTASHAKGRVEIVAEAPLSESELQATLSAMGYTLQWVKTEPYEKKGFSLFKK